ncbi:TonB-dependent receptor [Dickeya dadantii]|uniref:TonB-dependent siderophore receptor n=1 Tax=Dickeya dadantii TaxID=204038 RepID=UPI001CF203AD|nr:TonB-dependent receptor [Dickeya dadantii]MCA7013649.1 TonB-dependent receptor [Dickeya dadantii]
MRYSFWQKTGLHSLSLLTFALPVTAFSLFPHPTMAASSTPTATETLPLSEALLRIARQTNTTVVFDPDIVQPYYAAPVNTITSVEEALKNTLKNTDLILEKTHNGSYTVRRKPAAAPQPDKTGALPGNSATLPTVTVTGNRVAHLAQRNRTGTRTDTDPMTLAQSVTTVESDLLAQQQVRDVYEALNNVSGAGIIADEGSQSPGVSLRGFTASLMRNGDVVPSRSPFNPPLIALERIEVVKGPEAIVAGTTSYGGVVNVITKVPQIKPVREALISTGSEGYRELGMDLGDALNEDRTLLGRLIASSSDENKTSTGYDGSRRTYVSPAISWSNRARGTDVLLSYEWQRSFIKPLDTVLFEPGNPYSSNVKRMRFGPENSGLNSEQSVANLSINQRLLPGWSMGLKLGYNDRTDEGLSNSPRLEEAGSLNAVAFANHQSNKAKTSTIKLELNGDVNTGPIEHSLLFAYDRINTRLDGVFNTRQRWTTDLQTGESSPIDLFSADRVFRSSPRETGLLVLNHATWNDWSATLGYRYVTYNSGDSSIGGSDTLRKGLPSLGIVNRITPTFSVYSSLSQGFIPNTGLLTSELRALPPDESRQAELGFKSQLFDKRIALTGSVYRIREKNLAIEDLTTLSDSRVYYTTIPGANAKGFELDISGNVTSRLELRANYGYQDKRGDAFSNGGIPYTRHTGNLWASYRLGDDEAQGWWIGSGVALQSRVTGAAPGVIPPNAQYRIDLAVGYDTPKWSAIAGVKNITDKKLYSINSDGSGIVNAGNLLQQRAVTLTLRAKF